MHTASERRRTRVRAYKDKETYDEEPCSHICVGLMFGTLLGVIATYFLGQRYVVQGTYPRAIRIDRWTGTRG